MEKTGLNTVNKAPSIMKKNSVKVLLIFILLIITVYLLSVNRIVLSIRIAELQDYLQNIDRNEGSIDHIALVATYEIHKKIYEERITQDEADTAEHALNSLSISTESHTAKVSKLDRISSLPALHLINFNRHILGKPPVIFEQNSNTGYRELDEAYYYERNFLYKKAASFYSRALERNSFNSQYRSSILLRQGYCYAMAGYNDKAMKNYKTIISDYSNESSAITASILLTYLEGFNRAREIILLDKSHPVLKSRRLVNLLAYEQALKIIEEIENKASPGDLPSIQYFKARCYSGLGEPQKAVETYLKVVTSYPTSLYAKYSNRKLYMIGKSAGGYNRITEISEKLNKKLNDPVMNDFIQKYKKSELATNADYTPVIVDIPENLKDKIQEITDEKTLSAVTILMIITKDGNTFKGRLIEKRSDIISIQTSIGRIDVKTDRIAKVIEQK